MRFIAPLSAAFALAYHFTAPALACPKVVTPANFSKPCACATKLLKAERYRFKKASDKARYLRITKAMKPSSVYR